MSEKMDRCIYLDHHATTPVDERVLQKLKPFFLDLFGNPSSGSHCFGWKAQDAVNEARIKVAKSINAHPSEVIFTSGATESSNTLIKGLFFPRVNPQKNHAISSTIEHSATLMSLKALQPFLVDTSFVHPNSLGQIPLERIESATNEKTALVSLFFVNNEIGTINDIAAIGRHLKEKKILFHCDAAQALGRIPIDVKKLNIDAMSLSGHKIYGPKGVGVLYLKKELMGEIFPLIHGGGQEWHKRSGTLNVPGIVGMGEACALAVQEMAEDNKKIKSLRDRLLKNLCSIDGVGVNGTMEQRVSGNLNISFAGVEGEELVLSICSQVAVSTGSACASSSVGGSYVLREIGVASNLLGANLRFGIGRTNTIEEIDKASTIVVEQVKRLRNKNPKRKKITNILRNS